MELLYEIQAALDRPICSGWDRAFLESIAFQLDKGKVLTGRQKTILGRVLSQNTAQEEENLQAWKEKYFAEYYSIARQVAYYHLRQPYYAEMAKDILTGKVPRRKRFIKMINNKYTKKVLREYAKSPRFLLGTYVKIKTNFDRTRMSFDKYGEGDIFRSWEYKRKAFLNFVSKGGIILSVDDEIHSAAKGATRYKILAIGATIPFYVEERFLKRG